MIAYLKLFLGFLNVGLFSFGGGNAVLPLMRKITVVDNKWLSGKEFIDMIAISQATPGPIAINGATYVGFKVCGLSGSLVADLGIILPTFIIMLIFTVFFMKFRKNEYVEYAFLGILPTTVGMVAAAALLVSFNSFVDYKSVIIFVGVFIAAFKYEVDPILLIIISGILGFVLWR